MTAGNKNAETPEEQSVEAWVTLDTCLFDAARKQIQHYQELRESRGEVSYWETAYAAAAILLVCSTMEAHANYLLGRAARGTMPNRSGLSEALWSMLARQLRPRERWELACDVLLGSQIFDAGAYPFQQYLRAVDIRNTYIAHPKLTPRQVTMRGSTVNPSDFKELQLITIDTAERTVDAARGMVRLFYKALGAPPPKWAVD